MSDAGETAICSFMGISHISEKISRCCLQLSDVNYSLHVVHQAKYGKNKAPKNHNLNNSKIMTTKTILRLYPLMYFHVEIPGDIFVAMRLPSGYARVMKTPLCCDYIKPEDQWSCKRSPDILALLSTKHTKPGKIYGKEMTLTFNTYIPS